MLPIYLLSNLNNDQAVLVTSGTAIILDNPAANGNALTAVTSLRSVKLTNENSTLSERDEKVL